MRGYRRAVALLLLVWWLPACATYQSTGLAPEEAVIGQQSVRVTLSNAASTEVTVLEPWVRADSLGGKIPPVENWSVPLSSVVDVKTKRTNVLATVGLVIGTLGAAIVAAAIVACSPPDAWC